jgi:hypothetical protein
VEGFYTVLGSFLLGAGGTALINWLRFRRQDSAISQKHLSEAGAIEQNADANWLAVSSKELAIWIATASESKMTIIELTAEKRDLKHALGLCKQVVEQLQKQQKGK